MASELENRYRAILSRVKRKVEHRAVCLIAVSKKQPVDLIEKLYELGHRDFGENYVQELSSKALELQKRGCTEIRWHFLGHLQTNKVKNLIPWVHSVHSVDSIRLANELAKRWKESGRSGRLPIFVEVNISGEPSKSGVNPEVAVEISKELARFPELILQGLMCIPEEEKGELEFPRLRELEEKCRPGTQGQLSMGMSGDFEAALKAGSTHIRVGTAIFGER